MLPKVSIGACFISVLALSATIATAAPAANTWEGVWNTDFGRMTLGASGAGSYEGFSPGTVSGPAVGNVNEGTWSQPGNPPRSGPYRFVLSGGGQSFTGTWEYAQGGCGTACGWNGTCIEGACLNNGVTGGGGGGGGSCSARSWPLTAARADSCPDEVKFFFRTDDGLPDKPDDKDLPKTLLAIEAKGAGSLSNYDPISEDYGGSGNIVLQTTHTLGFDERSITLQIDKGATYVKNGDLRRVNFKGIVLSSSDPSCDDEDDGDDAPSFNAAFAVKGKQANLRLRFPGGSCLSDKPILWKTKSFEKASIKPAKP